MDVFDLTAKIILDTGDYESGLSNASTKTNSFGDTLKTGLATAAKAGAAAITAASGAVVAFGASAVSAGSNFDSSMSQVAATMGTTVDEIQNLRDFALEMGSATAFSASEAADALNYMALAGYDADESMEALPNVLNLAAAGGIDLATASDMVTDAQSALGLSMDESAELVDKMAMASSKSNTSVSQLGEAILTIGGTAKNLAGGTTELSTALGILADNGIKGAEGGTHLRNIILSLSAPTDTAAAAMASLGVEVFDAEGNMRPLNDTLGDLNDAMSTMTQEEKTNIISTIFNTTDISSVNALLANTGERWDELTGYIDDATGAAQAMADTQLDNLAGDITLFQSALEGAQIVVSDQLKPTLREFVQFGSEAISTLSTAFQEGGLSGAMDALGDVLTDGLEMVISMLPEVIDAGTQVLGALAEGILQNLPLLVESAAEIILTLADNLSESLPNLIPTVVEVMLEIVDTLIENVDKLVDAAVEIIVALAEGLITALPRLIEKAPEITVRLVTALIESAPKLLDAAAELVGMLAVGLVNGVPSIIQAALNFTEAIQDQINTIIKEAPTWGVDLIKSFISGITSQLGNLKSSVQNVAKTVKNLIGFSEPKEGPLSNFHTYAPDMMQLFAEGITDNADLVKDAFSNSLDFGVSTVTGAASNAAATATTAATQVVQDIVINLTAELDGATLARKQYRYNQRQGTLTGGSLVEVAG